MYTRAVLTRLIGHLHLKTGKCNPMLGTLALGLSRETGERAVRLVLEKAEKLGWIKRIYRHGGGGRHRNAANQYEFTLPPTLRKIADLRTIEAVERYADRTEQRAKLAEVASDFLMRICEKGAPTG